MRRIRGRKEVFMATMKDIITSPLLLAMVIIGLLYIVGFSLVYLKKAYTHCLELGISKEDLKNVIKCKNPRCITSIETNCDHIFRLSPSGTYRCIYCNQKISVH